METMQNQAKRYYNEIIFSEDEVKDIITLYAQNNSTTAIGKKYQVSHKTIAKVLKKHGIERTGKSRRKYNLDEHYFDVIDTQNKAYMLGFLFADGSYSKPKQTVSIALQEEDAYILREFCRELQYDKPLVYIGNSNKNDFGYTYKNQYCMKIYNAHVGRTLESYGMVQNKSAKLDFPNNLPDNMYKHFIRGYFDGNGSVCFSKNKNCSFSITSTKSFCVYLKEFIESELPINVSIYEASNHNGITSVLVISGKNQVEQIFRYLYKDATLFLHRKYQKFYDKYIA